MAKLIKYKTCEGSMFAVNPKKVSAIVDVEGKTRIIAGEFYADVDRPAVDVIDELNNTVYDTPKVLRGKILLPPGQTIQDLRARVADDLTKLGIMNIVVESLREGGVLQCEWTISTECFKEDKRDENH